MNNCPPKYAFELNYNNMHQISQKIIITITTTQGIVKELTLSSKHQAIHIAISEIERLFSGHNSDISLQMEVPKLPKIPETKNQQLNNRYQIDLLKEEILLFDSQQDISNYIQREILLAQNTETQLIELTHALITLTQQLLKQPRPLIELGKEQIYTRQRLDEIEEECMTRLLRVKEQRRRGERCCICLSGKSKIVALPCMHLALCGGCASSVSRCPLCSQPISQTRQVFR